MPEANNSTSTSVGPGSGKVISVIVNGEPCCVCTAARVVNAIYRISFFQVVDCNVGTPYMVEMIHAHTVMLRGSSLWL
jgi:hypothetical protein